MKNNRQTKRVAQTQRKPMRTLNQSNINRRCELPMAM